MCEWQCVTASPLCVQCRELEEMHVWFSRLLKGELMWGKKLEGGDQENGVDCSQLLDRCGLRASLIAQVERQAGWARLWGLAYQGAPVVEQGAEPPWEG